MEKYYNNIIFTKTYSNNGGSAYNPRHYIPKNDQAEASSGDENTNEDVNTYKEPCCRYHGTGGSEDNACSNYEHGFSEMLDGVK